MNKITEKQTQVEMLKLKTVESCDNIKTITDIMFGEGENQPLKAKEDLAYFLISESLKENRTLCQELHFRMPGGALKYSSTHHKFEYRKSERKKVYNQIRSEAETFWSEKRTGYKKMWRYNHFLTKKRAVSDPPSWFKYYIVSYKFSGDHVFIEADFSNIVKDKKSGKYLGNYWKIVKDIKNRG